MCARYDSASRSVAQPGSAPGLGPGGPRFESLYSDQIIRIVKLNLTILFNSLESVGLQKTLVPRFFEMKKALKYIFKFNLN
jgi:hypothetical protein